MGNSKWEKVYLVSDMYWPSKEIIEILHGVGVNDYQQILISCEEQKSKKNGELFEKLKKLAKQTRLFMLGTIVMMISGWLIDKG